MIVRMGEAQLCVLCHIRPVDGRWRPFCSERCRMIDLGKWAAEEYRVPEKDDPSSKPPES